MRRVHSTVLLASVALVLVGCSASPTSTSSTSPASASAEPTASSESVLAFDGECANAIEDTQLTSVLGSAAAPERADTAAYSWLPSVEMGGGISCTWYANAAGDDTIPGAEYVRVEALASDIVPAETKEHYATVQCEGTYDGTICYLGIDNGGAWALVSTGAGALDSSAVEASEALSELASFVDDNAQAYAAPSAASPGDGWWTRPDCDALGTAIDLESMFTHPVAGYWEGAPGAFEQILDAADLEIECPWASEYLAEGDVVGNLNVTIAPGSGARWDEMPSLQASDASGDTSSAVAEDIDIAGAVAAKKISYGTDQTMIVATDGVNILRITSSNFVDQVSVAETAIAWLTEDSR